MRLALCQIDTTVGDFAGNSALIVRGLARAEDAGADLAVFPELAICGYPPGDLLERPSFVREGAHALASLARRSHRTALLVGTFVKNRSRVGKPFHNVAALLEGGRVRALAKKTLLPTYDVFDGLCSRSPAAHGGGPVANAYDLIGEGVEGGLEAATKAFEASVMATR